jgi:hypothetical protein
VIELINHGSPARPKVDEFSEDDLFFVDLLAQSAAAAFDNARACAENQTRLRVLNALRGQRRDLVVDLARRDPRTTRAPDRPRRRAGGTIISGWHANAVRLEPIAHFRADDRLLWETGAPRATYWPIIP